AATSGQSARAIRLLGRILERDGEHLEARQLLESMRRRGRTLRLAMAGLGALCVGGLFTAGGLFLWGGDLPGPAPTAAVAAASVNRDDASTPTVPPSRVVIPTRADVEGAAGDRPPEEPAEKPEVPKRRGTNTSVPTGEGAAKAGPFPDKRNLAAGPRDTTECTVVVKGPPVAQLTHHRLQVGGQSITYDTAKRGYPVRLETERSRASLIGKRWEGSLTLERSQCASGPAVLTARAKPAKIVFRDLPAGVSPADVAIRCLEGCSEQGFSNRWATKVPYGQDRTTVRLLLTAVNEGTTYRVEREFRLYPGPNEQDARLKAIVNPSK
ncbi:MAG: hypothetical protein ACPHRO_10400, partial [Nannocystaceae bacterium]